MRDVGLRFQMLLHCFWYEVSAPRLQSSPRAASLAGALRPLAERKPCFGTSPGIEDSLGSRHMLIHPETPKVNGEPASSLPGPGQDHYSNSEIAGTARISGAGLLFASCLHVVLSFAAVSRYREFRKQRIQGCHRICSLALNVDWLILQTWLRDSAAKPEAFEVHGRFRDCS